MGILANGTANIPSDEYETPPDFYAHWNRVFNFQADLAASCYNTLVGGGHYFHKSNSALDNNWDFLRENLWLNPPYSQKAGPLKKWVSRCIHEAAKGASIVALLPDDSSTEYYNHIAESVYVARRIPIYKRLRFYYQGKPAPYAAPMPSMLVHFYTARP